MKVNKKGDIIIKNLIGGKMKRICIVGAGYRGYHMFAKNIKENFAGEVKFVGVCDPNKKRSQYYIDTIDNDMKLYTDFDLMIDQLKPDAVIVTTVDGVHHDYIIRALKKGCDVFSEKPITVDEEKCMLIRQAEKESGKKVTVTFNCRFMPYVVKIKELLLSGIIGKPLTLNYEYTLNKVHGGDYFKRWHRFMENSGGMMVHKATHHFDIVNWLLDDDPVSVSAHGARLYFGNESVPHGERCSTCEHASTCLSYENLISQEEEYNLYFATESEDGYVRDHCVFKGDTDIYDCMSVTVEYAKGALLTYSLTLFSTAEGYTLNIVGDKGRLEASTFFGDDNTDVINITLNDGTKKVVSFEKAGGTHAGGDIRMLKMLFGKEKIEDTLLQCAGSFDGIKSAMIGICANQSIKEKTKINLKEKLDKIL